MKRNIVVVVFVCFVLSVACATGDWPQYRADAGRTGYTADQLPLDLSLRWVYTLQTPMPAWKGTDTRMPFDYACQAVVADGKLFFGSTVDCRIYALDAATGKMKWTYIAEHSIRHNTIAIGGGRVYLIDRPVALIEEMKMRRPRPEGLKSTDHPSGTLVALDARTGKVLYKKQNDIYGTLLVLSTKYDVLVMTYQYIRNGLTSELGGRMTAFRASDGSLLWDVKTGVDDTLDYRSSSRPLINDRTIYLEPWAWDLFTGEKCDFTFRRTYGCGLVSGSKNVMFFRSGTLGYFDLAAPGKGTQSYGGIRPGCWINAIPAGGLVHMPDATEGCNCSYLIKATIALQPRSYTGSR